jgi:hypothetical protein
MLFHVYLHCTNSLLYVLLLYILWKIFYIDNTERKIKCRNNEHEFKEAEILFFLSFIVLCLWRCEMGPTLEGQTPVL